MYAPNHSLPRHQLRRISTLRWANLSNCGPVYSSYWRPLETVCSLRNIYLKKHQRQTTAANFAAHVCATGNACVSTLFELHDTQSVELKPTIVLIDTPHDEQRIATAPPSRDPSPHSKTSSSDGTDDDSRDVYGLRLLERILYETHSRNLSKLVVPVSVVTFPPTANSDLHGPLVPNRSLLRGCLDCGAADVMMSPLHTQTLTTLEVHAYRAHKEAAREQQAQMEITRGRKRSWVGVHDEQPFSYLREAMVSNLMSRICRPGEEHDAGIGSVRISVSTERRAEISRAVGEWHFCAHDFSDDQLLVAASLIFKHAFTMSELEPWRIPTGTWFVFLWWSLVLRATRLTRWQSRSAHHVSRRLPSRV